jgi:hypothetical protein
MPLATAGNEASWNVYALPAGITLVLLLVETLYLAGKLPETKDWQKRSSAEHKASGSSVETVETVETFEGRLARLRAAGKLHGLFLLFFSGVSGLVCLPPLLSRLMTRPNFAGRVHRQLSHLGSIRSDQRAERPSPLL